MRRVEASELVASLPERVFALYDDIGETPRWVPFVDAVLSVTPGRTGVGTVYRERTKLAGIPSVSEWRITEHRPPREQVHLSTAMGMDSRLTITFTQRGTGTLLAQAVELRSRLPGPLGWLHEIVVAAVASRGMLAAVQGAKRYLERS